MNAYDIIGDIHGHHDKLTALLAALGYEARGAGFRHPEGRRVVFLGDYIDRGPKIRETLHTVRAMVDAGDALAIMGNHEWNALNYHTRGRDGEWLRLHSEKNEHQHSATLNAFEGREEEWAEWLKWMAELPVALDLAGLRAVHAAWDDAELATLAGGSFADREFLLACADKTTAKNRAADRLMKGIEFRLPKGCAFHDKQGVRRTKARLRWWLENPAAATIRGLTFPDYGELPDAAIDAETLPPIPGYAADAPPCFFGHYWLPPGPAMPVNPNLACLDYSAAKDGPLVAYRWDGERKLLAEKYVTSTVRPREPAA